MSSCLHGCLYTENLLSVLEVEDKADGYLSVYLLVVFSNGDEKRITEYIIPQRSIRIGEAVLLFSSITRFSGYGRRFILYEREFRVYVNVCLICNKASFPLPVERWYHERNIQSKGFPSILYLPSIKLTFQRTISSQCGYST